VSVRPALNSKTRSKAKHRKRLERFLFNLIHQLSTPEGLDAFERLKNLKARVDHRLDVGLPEIELTPQEQEAFLFVRDQLRKGLRPTVREISKAAGYRSPRSGLVMIQRLIRKQVLGRDSQGSLY